MISALLAVAFTFTATATGVEKGTPLEFMFAGKDTDRDYETMFLLDRSISDFCRDLERVGIPRGRPTDYATCRLWPTGVTLTMKPGVDEFVDVELPENVTQGALIYTGGLRDASGNVDAAKNMPASVFSFYTLAQSMMLFNGIYEQGVVYGAYKAKIGLKKGEKRTFTLSWDEKTAPHSVKVEFKPGNGKEIFNRLKDLSRETELDVEVGFSDDLTVVEAAAVANALSTVDSPRVKVNGRRPGDFFYRAFLPLVKWRDRKERLTQPFEVNVGETNRVVFIEEDWSVEGNDPKLTERPISFEQMNEHPNTDTVFFFACRQTKLGDLKSLLKRTPKTVLNHYVYWE